MGVQTAHHEKMGVLRRKLNWDNDVPSANLMRTRCSYLRSTLAMVWSCMLLVPS